MKNIWQFLILSLIVIGCNSDEEITTKKEVSNTPTTETIDGIFYQYYPGTKKIKITGAVDKDDKRHGRWELYNESGKEMGFNMYKHGKRHGHSFTSYPNGSPLYYGEYWEDTLIGVWKSYSKEGKVITKDYGLPEGY